MEAFYLVLSTLFLFLFNFSYIYITERIGVKKYQQELDRLKKYIRKVRKQRRTILYILFMISFYLIYHFYFTEVSHLVYLLINLAFFILVFVVLQVIESLNYKKVNELLDYHYVTTIQRFYLLHHLDELIIIISSLFFWMTVRNYYYTQETYLILVGIGIILIVAVFFKFYFYLFKSLLLFRPVEDEAFIQLFDQLFSEHRLRKFKYYQFDCKDNMIIGQVNRCLYLTSYSLSYFNPIEIKPFILDLIGQMKYRMSFIRNLVTFSYILINFIAAWLFIKIPVNTLTPFQFFFVVMACGVFTIYFYEKMIKKPLVHFQTKQADQFVLKHVPVSIYISILTKLGTFEGTKDMLPEYQKRIDFLNKYSNTHQLPVEN